MTISEIFIELNTRLGEMEPRMKELQKAVNEYKEKLESAEAELAKLKDKYESIRMSKEALELLDDVQKPEQKETVKETAKEAKTEPAEKKPKKRAPLKWTTKNARLLKLDRNGNVIGNYPSQSAAARAMGWDQSSLSRFLKFDMTQQINKKNFYFKWEY